MPTLKETLTEISRLIERYQASGKTLDVKKTSGPVVDHDDKNKPLYELAYLALLRLGKPAKTKEVLPILREMSGRKNLTAMLTYQALEYCKRYKATVKRTQHGIWRPIAHH